SAAGLREWLDSSPVSRARIAVARREPRLVLITADSEDIALQRAMVLGGDAGARTVAVAACSGDHPEFEQALSVHALVRDAVPIIRMGVTDTTGVPVPSP